MVGGHQTGPGHINRGGGVILAESSKLKLQIWNNSFLPKVLSFKLHHFEFKVKKDKSALKLSTRDSRRGDLI